MDNPESLYKKLLESIGEDVNREGLKATPKRSAKALEYLTQGYKHNIEQVINGAIFTSDTDEMIIVKDIEVYSLCEHHLLPFFGKCHVGYLPKGKIIGLSREGGGERPPIIVIIPGLGETSIFVMSIGLTSSFHSNNCS